MLFLKEVHSRHPCLPAGLSFIGVSFSCHHLRHGCQRTARLRQLEDENNRLKKLVVDLSLDKHILREVLKNTSGVCAHK
jgi:hypothetical protein